MLPCTNKSPVTVKFPPTLAVVPLSDNNELTNCPSAEFHFNKVASVKFVEFFNAMVTSVSPSKNPPDNPVPIVNVLSIAASMVIS